MTFIPDRDPSEHGWLMNLQCDLGLTSTSVPGWIISRTGLDLSEEGVSTSGKITLFEARYDGERVVTEYLCPVRGEVREKVIIESGQVVTGGAGKGSFKCKIQAIFKDVQAEYGKAFGGGGVNAAKSWYWPASGMPKAMQAFNIAKTWHQEYFLPLMQGELYDSAKAGYEARVESMIAKVTARVEQERNANEALISNAGALDSLIRLRAEYNQQLDDLPQIETALKGKFPSRSKIAESFKVWHTEAKAVPSLVSQIQGDADAMKALETRLTAESGAQAAQLTMDSLRSLGSAIPDLIAGLRSELYEKIAAAIKDLRKIKPDNPTDQVRKMLTDHLARLRVVGEMLGDFNAWASQDGEFDHSQALERIAAISEKVASAQPGTTDREELVAAIDSLQADIADEVIQAKMGELELGKGAATLANMAMSILDERPEPIQDEGLTPQALELRQLLAEVQESKTTVARLREISPRFDVSNRDEGGAMKRKPDLVSDLVEAIATAIAEDQTQDFYTETSQAFAML